MVNPGGDSDNARLTRSNTSAFDVCNYEIPIFTRRSELAEIRVDRLIRDRMHKSSRVELPPLVGDGVGHNVDTITVDVDEDSDREVFKITDYSDMLGALCGEPGCTRASSYDYYRTSRDIYCNWHMYNRNASDRHCVSICIVDDCNNRANYEPIGNIDVGRRRLYCRLHRAANMIIPKTDQCSYSDGERCKSMGLFGRVNDRTMLYCGKHRTSDMEDTSGRRCAHRDCNVVPCYSHRGGDVGLYCSQHKDRGMVNVSAKSCVEQGCHKLGTYVNIGDRSRRYCHDHRLSHMILASAKYCRRDGCRTMASFGHAHSRDMMYCKSHREIYMVNVRDPPGSRSVTSCTNSNKRQKL